MTIRVLIADDHKLFRQGLISLMNTRQDLVEVVGEAESGEEAIKLAEQLKPDVILMDIYMPQGDGLQASKVIHGRFPEIAIVILTSSEKDGHLYEAVQTGVSGYLLKSLDAEELFGMLEGVTRGEAAMTRAMASRCFSPPLGRYGLGKTSSNFLIAASDDVCQSCERISSSCIPARLPSLS